MKNEKILSIKKSIQTKMVGNDKVLDLILSALLANGHILLEDTPGSGKTLMAKSIAQSLSILFKRIQFTPDLLPTDITGLSIYDQSENQFVFHPGPVFCNILLADEINRATPRTQASLLECMEERQVTVDGNTRKLAPPFFVIATQNPVETSGTFPLPEAQLDRFLMQLSMSPITKSGRLEILQRSFLDTYTADLPEVCTGEILISMQEEIRRIYVHPALMEYIAELAEESGNIPETLTGISHRGLLALLTASQAFAFVNGREYIVPEDIKAVAVPVWAHRLILEHGFTTTSKKEQLIQELLNRVSVPTENWKRG